MTIRIERITYNGERGRTTVWAEILSESERFLKFRRLRPNGSDYSFVRKKDGAVVDRQNLIDKRLIVCRERARENPTYGTLEIVEAA